MCLLLAAATDFELWAFAEAGGAACRVRTLITGIGPVETAFTLTDALHRYAGSVSAVINFGIAGAFPDSGARLLDICLAKEEVLGDFGICLPERIERFAERGLTVRDRFVLDAGLQTAATQALARKGVSCRSGVFVTVSSASGTAARARRLGHQYQGLCENMEGAAAARVCEAFGLPSNKSI